jgi:hypothetical protein
LTGFVAAILECSATAGSWCDEILIVPDNGIGHEEAFQARSNADTLRTWLETRSLNFWRLATECSSASSIFLQYKAKNWRLKQTAFFLLQKKKYADSPVQTSEIPA